MGSLIDDFDTGPLGLSLFQPGGYFGPEATKPVDSAKADLILRMLGRESELYPQIQEMLAGLPKGADDEAYGYDTGEISRLYPDIQKQITNYELDPNAQGFLTRLKDERINSMMGDVDKLISSKVAGLAGKGMMSSSTAEGAMGEVGRAVAPAISQANQDYWNARLTLPGQNAAQRYGMATTYGSTMGDAARQRRQSLYQPLSTLSNIWGTTAGAGNSPTPAVGDSAKGQERLVNTVGSLAALFA